MKKIIVLGLVCFLSTCSFGQIAKTFNDAHRNGIEMARLDSNYMSGVHVDSTKAAFAGKEEEYFKTWTKMLQDLANYLKKNNFSWGQETNCFNKIYFKSDGSIDYFLYVFSPALVTEKENQFNTLLNEFIKTYKFGMRNKVNFSQCGPVVYNDLKKL